MRPRRGLSCRRHRNALDPVAHVARRLPQRFHRLTLPRTVPRAHADVVSARGRREREREFAERIAAEILAQFRLAPALSAVGRAGDFADALPAVERDAAY